MDYLIYILTDGDITKAEAVGELTYPEAVKWLQLKKYEGYMQKKAIDRG